MENYCTKAKKEHFFPEFSNCTFNSSSVDNEQQRQDRGKSRVEDEEGRVEKSALRPNKVWIPPVLAMTLKQTIEYHLHIVV